MEIGYTPAYRGTWPSELTFYGSLYHLAENLSLSAQTEGRSLKAALTKITGSPTLKDELSSQLANAWADTDFNFEKCKEPTRIIFEDCDTGRRFALEPDIARQVILKAKMNFELKNGDSLNDEFQNPIFLDTVAKLFGGKINEEKGNKMNNEKFIKLAKQAISFDRFGSDSKWRKTNTKFVHQVWFCKTLQNWKGMFFVDSEAPGSDVEGKYYEVTYDGDKKKLYMEKYQSKANVEWYVKGDELAPFGPDTEDKRSWNADDESWCDDDD